MGCKRAPFLPIHLKIDNLFCLHTHLQDGAIFDNYASISASTNFVTYIDAMDSETLILLIGGMCKIVLIKYKNKYFSSK